VASFKEFRAGVVAELAPDGFLEVKIVCEIASLKWRLGNLHIFRKAEEARKEYAEFLNKGSLDGTYAAYSAYEVCHLLARMEDKNKRLSMTREEAAAELRKTREKMLGSEAAEMLEAWLKTCLKDEDPLEILSISPEQHYQRVLRALEKTFGRSWVEKAKAEAQRRSQNGNALELAYFGDVVTVENYAEELKLAKKIEKAIDRKLQRYWKLKNEKRKNKERSNGASRLLPPY